MALTFFHFPRFPCSYYDSEGKSSVTFLFLLDALSACVGIADTDGEVGTDTGGDVWTETGGDVGPETGGEVGTETGAYLARQFRRFSGHPTPSFAFGQVVHFKLVR